MGLGSQRPRWTAGDRCAQHASFRPLQAGRRWWRRPDGRRCHELAQRRHPFLVASQTTTQRQAPSSPPPAAHPRSDLSLAHRGFGHPVILTNSNSRTRHNNLSSRDRLQPRRGLRNLSFSFRSFVLGALHSLRYHPPFNQHPQLPIAVRLWSHHQPHHVIHIIRGEGRIHARQADHQRCRSCQREPRQLEAPTPSRDHPPAE